LLSDENAAHATSAVAQHANPEARGRSAYSRLPVQRPSTLIRRHGNSASWPRLYALHFVNALRTACSLEVRPDVQAQAPRPDWANALCPPCCAVSFPEVLERPRLLYHGFVQCMRVEDQVCVWRHASGLADGRTSRAPA